MAFLPENLWVTWITNCNILKFLKINKILVYYTLAKKSLSFIIVKFVTCSILKEQNTCRFSNTYSVNTAEIQQKIVASTLTMDLII